MPLQSDIVVNAAKFDPSRVSEKLKQQNQKLIQIWKDGPRWYEVCKTNVHIHMISH